MYKRDCAEVNAWSQQSAANMFDMVMMVSLSIQQPWSGVGNQLEDYRALGRDSRFVWGNKVKTFDYLSIHSDRLFRETKSAATSSEMMAVFIQIDGMGLAKAGFCCQLFNSSVGCIDSHNLKRLNIPASTLSWSSKALPATQARKIAAYVDACERRRSEWLWNTWCNLIATKYPTHFSGSEQVSRCHVTYLIPGA